MEFRLLNMISHRDMLNIIATEALEGGDPRHYADERNYRQETRRISPTRESNDFSVHYGLRVVREKDGSLKWEDS